MKIEILERVTVYPDPKGKPVELTPGEVREDFDPEYADLLITKGHAKKVTKSTPATTPVPAESMAATAPVTAESTPAPAPATAEPPKPKK
jgi:hypothetical protein